MCAPICLFVYNRLEHTKLTIESLLDNTDASYTVIYIFSDAAKSEKDEKNVLKVRDYIKTIRGFKKIIIIEQKLNKGLACSIIDGVSFVLKKHDSVMVFEDDLISSKDTISYLNFMLNYYRNEQNVISVTSYNYPKSTLDINDDYDFENYFTGRPCSWGWATWKDRWENIKWEGDIYSEYLNNKTLQKEFKKYAGVDIDRMLKKQLAGKINSWAVRFVYNCFIQGKVASYPVKSYITNIGADGTGTHKGLNDERVQNKVLHLGLPGRLCSEFCINSEILKKFNKFVSKRYYLRRVIHLAKGFLA